MDSDSKDVGDLDASAEANFVFFCSYKRGVRTSEDEQTRTLKSIQERSTTLAVGCDQLDMLFIAQSKETLV